MTDRPRTIETCITNLPVALSPLITRPNWNLWKFELSRNKWTKVPYQPNGSHASSTNRGTWSSYDAVIDAYSSGRFDGIGFVLDNDIAAFDIDDCRDAETNLLAPWASQLIERADSYAEVTISGTGIRIIGFGTGEGNYLQRKLKVDSQITCEIYRGGARYIVMTGVEIGSRPMVNIDAIMEEVKIELVALNERQQRSQSNGSYVDDLKDTIKNGGGDRHGPTRSDNVWWAINEMMRSGYAKDKIYATIIDPSNGISDHVRDQANPDRYANRQIKKACDEINFYEDRNGKKLPRDENIYVAMTKMGIVTRYNDFSGYIMIEAPEVTLRDLKDSDIVKFKFEVGKAFSLKVSKDQIYDAFRNAATINIFHPVRDYLNGLQWDGTHRVDEWLIKYCGAKDTAYIKAVGAIMLVAAVRRVRCPGCKFDEVVVLEGPQGTEKSSTLSLLAIRDEWFSDSLTMNSANREVLEQTMGRWIIELAELSGMRRADVEHLKAFTSRQTDRGRMAYDRIATAVQRQFILVGTTNSFNYLRDLTGNRRFWPVRIEIVDLEKLRRDRDQLWAEASSLEAQGYSIRLERRLWDEAEQNQQARVTTDPYHDKIEYALQEFESGKIPAVAVWDILSIAAGNRTQDQNQRVGVVMRTLGWRHVKIRNGSSIPVNGYTKGEQPHRLIVVERNGDGIEAHYENETSAM